LPFYFETKGFTVRRVLFDFGFEINSQTSRSWLVETLNPAQRFVQNAQLILFVIRSPATALILRRNKRARRAH
jgi:hypothetical protein